MGVLASSHLLGCGHRFSPSVAPLRRSLCHKPKDEAGLITPSPKAVNHGQQMTLEVMGEHEVLCSSNTAEPFDFEGWRCSKACRSRVLLCHAAAGWLWGRGGLCLVGPGCFPCLLQHPCVWGDEFPAWEMDQPSKLGAPGELRQHLQLLLPCTL